MTITIETIKDLLELQKELTELALKHYADEHKLRQKYKVTTHYEYLPENLRFKCIDALGVTLCNSEDFEYEVDVPFSAILDPRSHLERVESGLIESQLSAEARRAARFERDRAEAAQQIEKLKEKYGL